MKKVLLGLTLAASGLAGATSATAATIYAQDVIEELTVVGTRPGTPAPLDAEGIANGDLNRYTQDNVLGTPDTAFYSLGRAGSMVLDFGRLVRTPGTVMEVTFARLTQGGPGLEKFSIFASLTTDFTGAALLGNFDNGFGTDTGRTLSYSLTADVGNFRYVKIVDMTTDTTSPDGADIESIGFSPIPVPAAGLLLGGALMGLGALRRRAPKAA